jgi:hypothetical protein
MSTVWWLFFRSLLFPSVFLAGGHALDAGWDTPTKAIENRKVLSGMLWLGNPDRFRQSSYPGKPAQEHHASLCPILGQREAQIAKARA